MLVRSSRAAGSALPSPNVTVRANEAFACQTWRMSVGPVERLIVRDDPVPRPRGQPAEASRPGPCRRDCGAACHAAVRAEDRGGVTAMRVRGDRWTFADTFFEAAPGPGRVALSKVGVWSVQRSDRLAVSPSMTPHAAWTEPDVAWQTRQHDRHGATPSLPPARARECAGRCGPCRRSGRRPGRDPG